MPLVLAAPFALLCLWLLWRKKRAELAMLLVSLLVAFGGLEVAVRIMADDIFYREHERYAMKNRYRSGIETILHARFGDMVAMDARLKEALAEPHDITFKTDSRGFRNNNDYAGEPYVVLGDSFAATVGNSQADIVVSQLNAAMPNQFYSMGFPGAPKDYEANALTFMATQNDKARYVWFIFEGNDLFMPNQDSGEPYRPKLTRDVKDIINLRALPFLATRVLKLLAKNAGAMWKNENSETVSPVSVYEVGGHKIGFLNRYIEQAAAPVQELRILGTPEIMSRTACVFFIPEKYRVYKPWIEHGPAISEPAVGLAALHTHFDAHHIPVIDLTPALQKAAAVQIKQGKFVYWRDDTHWNANGINAIVPAVKACLERTQNTNALQQKNL